MVLAILGLVASTLLIATAIVTPRRSPTWHRRLRIVTSGVLGGTTGAAVGTARWAFALVWGAITVSHLTLGAITARQYQMPRIDITRFPMPDIATRHDTIPILAWKNALLVHVPEVGVRFRSMYGDPYTASPTRASHEPWDEGGLGDIFGEHDAPRYPCACGWNARSGSPTGSFSGADVVLDVELSGTVHVYEHGYRAEWQRVLAAHYVPRCGVCPDAPEMFGVAINGGRPIVYPVCRRHARLCERIFTFDEVAADIGCPLIGGLGLDATTEAPDDLR
jgi:hypothetical protein